MLAKNHSSWCEGKLPTLHLVADALIDADGHKSFRIMTTVSRASRSYVHRILRKDLKLRPFKPTVSQPITEAQIANT